jgi:hypothetical protein
MENELLHEISDPTGDLHAETQVHQSGYLLNGGKHRKFSVDDTEHYFNVFSETAYYQWSLN